MRLAARAVDILVSAAALIVLSPLMAAVACMVALNLGRPVLFRHQRTGLNERLFMLLKFRTMLDSTDEAGNLLPDEQRSTRLGNLLRSASLDELPQFWNVLRGDMTLVGPRPMIPRYLPRYTDEQRRRHLVKPGITGWAQIHGRNALSWERKFALDVWYVDNRSPWLDLKILAATPWVVVRREGVSPEGTFSSPEFWGTSREGA